MVRLWSHALPVAVGVVAVAYPSPPTHSMSRPQQGTPYAGVSCALLLQLLLLLLLLLQLQLLVHRMLLRLLHQCSQRPPLVWMRERWQQ